MVLLSYKKGTATLDGEPVEGLDMDGMQSQEPLAGGPAGGVDTEDFPVGVLSLGEDGPGASPDPMAGDFPLPPEPAAAPEPAKGKADPAPAPSKKNGGNNKGAGPLAALGRLFGYRLAVVKKGDASQSGDLIDPSQEGDAPAPAKAKKAKKEKKPKEKKAKAPKKKAAPKPKAKKPAKDKGEKGGKKKLLLFILLGVLVLAGVAIILVVVLGGSPTPEELLEQAGGYAAEAEYQKAMETYEEVVASGELVPEAYLGMADTLVASGDLEGALGRLELGYQETSDERLAQKMEELSPPEPGEAGPPAPSTQPIVWKDAAFESMVRLALNKPSGDISESDLAGVTTLKIMGAGHASAETGGLNAINGVNSYTIGEETFTERGAITSLDDVVHFKNLTRLTIGYNQVRDISALEQMNLSTVGLYANAITDISPLARVSGLKFLYLYNNNIADISPLAGQTELVSLSLQYNQIRDISPLAGMSKLEELYISHNQVEDLSPLQGLSSLTFLDLQDNNVSDIGVVTGLSKLTDANFQGNPVADFSPAAHVQNLNRSFGRTAG